MVRSGIPQSAARKTVFSALIGVTLGACASGEVREDRTAASIEETQAWLRAVQPETVKNINFREPLRYEYLNNKFVTMDVRGSLYLLELERTCPALTYEPGIHTQDNRVVRGVVRAGADTIRGCRIAHIYRVPDVEREAAPEVELEVEPEQEPQA